MRYVLVAVLAALTGGAAESVTLSRQPVREREPGVDLRPPRGAISSRAAGEYVEVLGRYCGAKADRLISGTQTTSGGRFRVENPSERPPYGYTPVYSGTTLRARWRGVYSKPQLWTSLARPKVAQDQRHADVGRPRHAGHAEWPGEPAGQDINHQAAFTVPTPGLRLRVFLPEDARRPATGRAAPSPGCPEPTRIMMPLWQKCARR